MARRLVTSVLAGVVMVGALGGAAHHYRQPREVVTMTITFHDQEDVGDKQDVAPFTPPQMALPDLWAGETVPISPSVNSEASSVQLSSAWCVFGSAALFGSITSVYRLRNRR